MERQLYKSQRNKELIQLLDLEKSLVYFNTSLKGSIEHGHNNNLTLDLSSVAYWYQSEAHELPAAPTKADRAPKPFIRDQDMHRWRHEWRKNFGNGSKLWGNERK